MEFSAGAPADEAVVAVDGGERIAFLQRHGRFSIAGLDDGFHLLEVRVRW